MNLFAEMRVLVTVALDKMITEGQLPQGLSFENVAVEPPRDALHGDMATNAAMVLAKPSRQKPRDIADKLAAHLMQEAWAVCGWYWPVSQPHRPCRSCCCRALQLPAAWAGSTG